MASNSGKGTFDGLVKAQNISLATKKGRFEQIRKGYNIYTNHRKLEDKYWVENPFGSLNSQFILTVEFHFSELNGFYFSMVSFFHCRDFIED